MISTIIVLNEEGKFGETFNERVESTAVSSRQKPLLDITFCIFVVRELSDVFGSHVGIVPIKSRALLIYLQRKYNSPNSLVRRYFL